MAAARWVTLEGGVAQTFPLSINQSVHWTGLRRGECSTQDMTTYELDGILSYGAAPLASPSTVVKQFVENIANSVTELRWHWAYGRWWRINPTNELGYRFEYSDVGLEATDPSEVTAIGTIDFKEDGTDEIRQISTGGDGKWFILKPKCGYVITNADGDSGSFRKSAAYFGIGCSSPGRYFTNTVLTGHVASAWDGGGQHDTRHFLWNGDSDPAELSRNVRVLAGQVGKGDPNHRCVINWSQSLVIANQLVYDMDQKRVLYYSGAGSASVTTRPYFDPLYIPVVVRRFAVYTDGKEGQFTITCQFGQAEADLATSRPYDIKITNTAKNRFRQVISLDNPARCRVFRVKITGLGGCGITQIDAEVEKEITPDSADGHE